jgi:excisionase family DNA binding protein
MESRTDAWLTLPEVAVRLGVCVGTVRRLILRDGLPAARIGRQVRVSVLPFKAWCDRQAAG